MAFVGYSKNVPNFFKALDHNNNKDWFAANKPRFQDEIIEPSIQLIAELSGQLSTLSPPLKAEPKVNGSIRRIYRDIRFSKDKTPYHSYLHLVFWAGDHPNKSPGVHVTLGARGFGFGAGHWVFEGETLENFRLSVLADGGDEIQTAIALVEKSGAVLGAPELKKLPRGYTTDTPGSSWLRYKGLVVKSLDNPYPDALFGAGAVDYIAQICRSMSPLNQYLMAYVYT